MADQMTPTDYLIWVQRSLNRILGSALPTDGSISLLYRDLVREFQFSYGLSGTGDIGQKDQNALIKANHKTPEYIYWAQRALKAVGAGSDIAVSGIADHNTIQAIVSFQSYQDLVDDGWVGAKTETALVKATGFIPPGDKKRVQPAPGKIPPVPKRVVPLDPLPIGKRVDRVINQVLLEVVHRPDIYPNQLQRRRLGCFLNLLKPNVARNDRYIESSDARIYVLGSTVTFAKGYTPDDISRHARTTLERRISNLTVDDRTQQEKIRKVILHLYYDIERGLNQINTLYNIHGDTNNGAKLLHQWAYEKQQKPHLRSILRCFA